MEQTRRYKLVVPDVVGLHWENAVLQLRNEGFHGYRIHYTEAYEDVDTVVAQAPLKGQIAASDETIALTVSKRNFVRFLPSIYQSTGAGVDPDFIRNFLWIFHHVFDSVSRRIDGLHRQFSPYTADEEFLPWLAQWVSVTLDADWPTVKKRKMLRSAAELYQSRGTPTAVRRLLEIFTDVTPTIVENEWPYDGFWVGVHSAIGVDTIVLPPVNLAHCFVVRFPRTYEQLGEEMVARIHQIIQAEKPAHAVYFLEFSPEPVTAGVGEGDEAGIEAISYAAPEDEGAPADAEVDEGEEAPMMPMGIGVAAAMVDLEPEEGGEPEATEAPASAAAEPSAADDRKAAAPTSDTEGSGDGEADADEAADDTGGDDEASESGSGATKKRKRKSSKGKSKGKSRRKKKSD